MEMVPRVLQTRASSGSPEIEHQAEQLSRETADVLAGVGNLEFGSRGKAKSQEQSHFEAKKRYSERRGGKPTDRSGRARQRRGEVEDVWPISY